MLGLISIAILTAAPTEIFKAFFLWTTATGLDPAGQSQCNRTWLQGVDGFIGFSTVVSWAGFILFVAIHAHMILEVYKARKAIISGANVRGGCFSSFFGGGFAASSGVSRSHMTDASVYCGSPAFLW